MRPRRKTSYRFEDEDDRDGFIRKIQVDRTRTGSETGFPWSLPVLKELEELELHPMVTFFVGENGSGKSTLLEGIAQAAGFAKEGGSRNFNLHQNESWSDVGRALNLVRSTRREQDTFYLRGESFFNVATRVEELAQEPGGGDYFRYYGGRSPHQQSHGESFLALATHRFAGEGLYLLDEPESALSPARQLSFLKLLDRQARRGGSQFIVATHSPIFMSYPEATIYEFSERGILRVSFEETEHFRLTLDFLSNYKVYQQALFRDE